MAGQLADSDEVISRRVERLLEERAVERIVLGGSPVVELPAHMVEAAHSRTAYHGYAPSLGEPQLREAIVEGLSNEGIPAPADRVLVTNGAMQALDICFRTLLASRGAVLNVLMPYPGFFIQGLVERAGGELLGLPSPEGDGFRPDWEAARRLITPRTRVLFVNSPVNPTGYVFDADDLAEAASLAAEHDLWIVSDESYSHFVYGGRSHRSICAFPGAGERTILVRSFSKDYAMPGWRLGYMVMPPALAGALARAFEWSCLCVNRLAQAVGLAALSGPQDWIRRFVADAERRATLVSEGLNAIPGIRCRPPAGGLNILVGFAGETSELVERLVLDGGVPAHPGEAFGAPGYFRLQFGATDEALASAIERISSIVRRRSAAARGEETTAVSA